MEASLSKNLFIFCVVFCFTLVKAIEEDVGNANDYIDEVLQNLQKETSVIAEFDPLDIPEVNEQNFQISNGQVRGLSNLYRHGDCTLSYEDDNVKISVQAGVRNLAFDVRYRAKALFFWVKGQANGEVDDLAVKIDITSKDGKAQLDSFKVIHLGNYKIKKITGMSVVLNWLLKLIANSVAKKSRGKIINAVEGGVARAVGDLLAKHKLSL